MSREDMGKEFAWSILTPVGYNVLNCSYRTKRKEDSRNSGWFHDEKDTVK